MSDEPDLNSFLRGLSADEFASLKMRLGSSQKDAEALIQKIEVESSDEFERYVCRSIRALFNVPIPTAAERREAIARSLAERQANAAEKATDISAEALSVAKHSRCWTVIAVIVAAAALAVSIIAILRQGA